MTGIYFSGTGNTKHCIEQFITALTLYRNESAQHPTQIISIEESAHAAEALKNAHDMIIIAYPIYYSNLPKIVRDFIVENKKLWKGKRFLSSVLWGCSAVTARVYPQGFSGNMAQTSSAAYTLSCQTASVMSDY